MKDSEGVNISTFIVRTSCITFEIVLLQKTTKADYKSSVNCTEHRRKVEIYAVNFFTNGSFLMTLDNGVPFHDAEALEVLSGDFKEKTVLSGTTYCYIQWLRGSSIKGR